MVTYSVITVYYQIMRMTYNTVFCTSIFIITTLLPNINKLPADRTLVISGRIPIYALSSYKVKIRTGSWIRLWLLSGNKSPSDIVFHRGMDGEIPYEVFDLLFLA